MMSAITRWLGAVGAVLGRNLPAKLIAATFAFVLWFFVNAGERETDVLEFPVELRNVPPGTVLVDSERVGRVAVRLNGPGLLLASLDTNRFPITVDLVGLKPGREVSLRIREHMIRLPRGVRILDIEPSRIPVHLEALESVELPVKLARAGKPERGYEVEALEVKPTTVRVAGPASVVKNLSAIETAPLDLRGRQASGREALSLVRPKSVTSVTPAQVQVEVRIADVVATRDFRRVEVDVRNLDAPFQLRPPRVNLTVKGPERIVEALRLEPESVYVDAAAYREAGVHEVEVAATLPEGVEVVRWEPARLRLDIQGREEDGDGS